LSKLSVCSLSWADVDTVRPVNAAMAKAAMWKRPEDNAPPMLRSEGRQVNGKRLDFMLLFFPGVTHFDMQHRG
jgi:hypothetical protein